MPRGQAARERHRKAASQAKVKAKKDARRAEKVTDMEPAENYPLVIPVVTEDDLLAFQYSHFGDDTRPETFFVDPQRALDSNFGGQATADEDDLGWYSDGVKRTLTDEQIEMFRHSEMMASMPKHGDYDAKSANDSVSDRLTDSPAHSARDHTPDSRASSLEPELRHLATQVKTRKPSPPSPRQHSQSSRSESSHATRGSSRPRGRRKRQIPYEQRNKRKWEKFVEEFDPVEGSMTQRRLVRELDKQKSVDLELDY